MIKYNVLCFINASQIVGKSRERKERKEGRRRKRYIMIYILAMHDTMLAMNVKMNDENGRKPRTNDMIRQTRSPEVITPGERHKKK